MGSPARCPGAGVGLGLSPGLWPGLPVGARAPSCPDECSAGAQSCPVWHLVTARCVRHPQPGAVRGPGVCPHKRAWSNTPFIPLGSSSLSPPPLPVPGWGRPLWAEAAGTQPRSHQAAEMRSVFTLLAISSAPAHRGVRLVLCTGGPLPGGSLYCHLGLTYVAPEESLGCLVRPPRSPGTSGRRGTCPSPASGH